MQVIAKGVKDRAKVPGSLAFEDGEIPNAEEFQYVHSLNEASQWQNNDTFRELLLAIVKYCGLVKERLRLRPDHPAILVIDNYKAHTLAVEKWRLFADGEPKWLIILFLPPRLTQWLQPLDTGVNGPFKSAFKSARRQRLREEVREQWRDWKTASETKVDLKWSTAKQWLLKDPALFVKACQQQVVGKPHGGAIPVADEKEEMDIDAEIVIQSAMKGDEEDDRHPLLRPALLVHHALNSFFLQ
eukprot:gene7952-18092_t